MGDAGVHQTQPGNLLTKSLRRVLREGDRTRGAITKRLSEIHWGFYHLVVFSFFSNLGVDFLTRPLLNLRIAQMKELNGMEVLKISFVF